MLFRSFLAVIYCCISLFWIFGEPKTEIVKMSLCFGFLTILRIFLRNIFKSFHVTWTYFFKSIILLQATAISTCHINVEWVCTDFMVNTVYIFFQFAVSHFKHNFIDKCMILDLPCRIIQFYLAFFDS